MSLEFLQYMLPFIVDLNQEFQCENPKIHTLYEKMSSTYKTILGFYLKTEYMENTNIEKIQ